MARKTVVLASASPRRRELLSVIFPEFEVCPSTFDEACVPQELGPVDHVIYSAKRKAADVCHRYPEALVIAADTIVVVEGQILGKPVDQEDACRMLHRLSAKTHQVYTGLAIADKGHIQTAYECTDVTFRELSDELIRRYVATGEPMDKAGAYAIQGKASIFVTGIRGCFFNVVGLPVSRLSLLLEELGYEPIMNG
ncbi:MAG: Maf family protein [Armatimonadota bacterium]|nr:Maf family protein [Armatimonadota bacterium]